MDERSSAAPIDPTADDPTFDRRDTLHHFIGAAETREVQQQKASAIISRDITRKAWDTATRKLVPVLPQVEHQATKRSGLSDADRIAASTEAKRSRTDDTSDYMTQQWGRRRGGGWQTHRGTGHQGHDWNTPNWKQHEGGAGRANSTSKGKGKGRGSGRGRGRGKKGKGKGKSKGRGRGE